MVQKLNRIQLTEAITLGKSKRSGRWYMYFRLEGKKFRKSARTQNLDEAKSVAIAEYSNALRRIEYGVMVEQVSFDKLSRKYALSLQGQNKQIFHSETLSRHFKPYFGKFDDIASIRKSDLQGYLSYRKEKSGYKVLNQSLNKENAVFNQMMRFAKSYDWIKDELRLPKQSEKGTYNRRPHFTDQELEILLRTAKKRCDDINPEYATGQKRALLTVQYWNRTLLYETMLIILYTGLRVDEVKTVRWKDIDWNNNTLKLTKAGKTKSSRIVIVRSEGLQAFKRLYDIRAAYAGDETFDVSERVQSLPNGTYVESFKTGFRSLLSACGFQYQTVQDRHALTSLRHTYATQRLTAEKGKRASMRALAKQMGTSQKMIEQHYGHDVVEDYRDELLN